MASNTPTLSTIETAQRGAAFSVNVSSADVSAQVEVKAAPGAGKHIYITHVTIQSADADAHPYLQDANATLLGPLYTTVEGTSFNRDFPWPIRLTANQALNVNAAAAGNVWVYVEGYAG